MDENKRDLPYIYYESEAARWERDSKRKNRLIIFLLIFWFLSVAILGVVLYLNEKGWKDFISEYDIETYTYDQDGEGVNIVGDGNGVDYNNGTARIGEETDKEDTGKRKNDA